MRDPLYHPAQPYDQESDYPAFPPDGWRVIQPWGDGWALAGPSGLRVVIDAELKNDDQAWLHVSVSRKGWVPSWEDLKLVKNTFIGEERDAMSVYTPVHLCQSSLILLKAYRALQFPAFGDVVHRASLMTADEAELVTRKTILRLPAIEHGSQSVIAQHQVSLYSGCMSDQQDDDVHILHPLDEPLGDIHEIAIALSMWSKRMPWEPELTRMAVRLAEAHDTIQNWVLEHME